MVNSNINLSEDFRFGWELPIPSHVVNAVYALKGLPHSRHTLALSSQFELLSFVNEGLVGWVDIWHEDFVVGFFLVF